VYREEEDEMILKATSRTYGEKLEAERVGVKISGMKLKVVAKDFWEGPIEPGDEGRWVRGIFLEE
jgi:hypothetical protein